jgi:hypothetical protein
MEGPKKKKKKKKEKRKKVKGEWLIAVSKNHWLPLAGVPY